MPLRQTVSTRTHKGYGYALHRQAEAPHLNCPGPALPARVVYSRTPNSPDESPRSEDRPGRLRLVGDRLGNYTVFATGRIWEAQMLGFLIGAVQSRNKTCHKHSTHFDLVKGLYKVLDKLCIVLYSVLYNVSPGDFPWQLER